MKIAIEWERDRRVLVMFGFRGVLDQHSQHLAGTGFTGLLHRIWPDYLAGFYRIIRP